MWPSIFHGEDERAQMKSTLRHGDAHTGIPARLLSVRRQNMKVRINATGDTIVMKFVRPNADTKLEGYILGYGSSMFSKQFIPLPENGKPYETEFDAEPKYLIAVQPIPTNDVKKHCTGKVELEKPLHLVIGSVTPTSVLLSWGTLLKTPYEGNIMNDCLEDGHYTVRYRERNRKWNYQTCPTSDTVIDNLKPNAVYEFGVQPSSKDRTGSWSKPVIHNISSAGIQEKVIRKIFKRPMSPVKPLTQGPHLPFTPRHAPHSRTQSRIPNSRHITPKPTLAPTTTTRQEALSTPGPAAPVTPKQPIGGSLSKTLLSPFYEVPLVPNLQFPLQITAPMASVSVPRQNGGKSQSHPPLPLNLHQPPTQSKPRPQQPQSGSQPTGHFLQHQLTAQPIPQSESYPDLELEVHATTRNPIPTRYPQTSQATPEVEPQSQTRSTPKVQIKLETQTESQPPLSQPLTTSQPEPRHDPITRFMHPVQVTAKPADEALPKTSQSTKRKPRKQNIQTMPHIQAKQPSHHKTSQAAPKAKPQSQTRSTPKVQIKLKTQTEPQTLSQPQTTSQPGTHFMHPIQVTTNLTDEAHPKTSQSTKRQPQKQNIQTMPHILAKQPSHHKTSQAAPKAKPQSQTRSTPKVQIKLKTQTEPQPLSQPQTTSQPGTHFMHPIQVTTNLADEAHPKTSQSTKRQPQKHQIQTMPHILAKQPSRHQTSQATPKAKPQSQTRSTPKVQIKLKTQTEPQPLSQPQTTSQPGTHFMHPLQVTAKPADEALPKTSQSTKRQPQKHQIQTMPHILAKQPSRHQTSQATPKAEPQSQTRSTPKVQIKLETQTEPQPLSQPQTTSQADPRQYPRTHFLQPLQVTAKPADEARPKTSQSTKRQPQKQKIQTMPHVLAKQPSRHQTSQATPKAKPRSQTRLTPKVQIKLKTQTEPQPLSEPQTTSQPDSRQYPRTHFLQPLQVTTKPADEAHPKTSQSTKRQPQKQQIQTMSHILPKQSSQSIEPQIKTSESTIHFETTFQPFTQLTTTTQPHPSPQKHSNVQSTSKPRTHSLIHMTRPVVEKMARPQTQPGQQAKSQNQPVAGQHNMNQSQPFGMVQPQPQPQPQSHLLSDTLPQKKPAPKFPSKSQSPPQSEPQTEVNPAPKSQADLLPGIEILPQGRIDSGPVEVPPLQAVPTAPSPQEKGKPLPIPAPAAEKPDNYNLGTPKRRVEAPRSPTSSAAIPAGRNTTFSRVRPPPQLPRNGVGSLSTSSHSSKISGAHHHKSNALPKPGAWSKEKPVLRQSVPVNKRPNLVGMPNDHDKPMDLKQGDKESILKPFPLVTSKPKQDRRQQTTTTTTTPLLNSSRFDINENSSIFRPLPASDVDIMGKKRYVAPHVIYKTDKKPDEPCSITSSLAYFPDEEDGADQNVTAAPRIPPSNLTVVTVEGCPSFVILDWQKSDNETREYEVVSTAKGPNGEEVSISTTTNQTHTAVENLKPESSYEFKVTPKNELGTGPSSEPVSFNTESADPRVSENVSGKDAIWTQFPFKTDAYSECNGKQYVKRTWYRKFVGIQLCNSLRYKIYLSDSLNGKFYNIGDQSGHGEDHCQFVDSFLDGRTGTHLFADQLPSRLGYFRALRQEPVSFGEIGGKSHVTYVGWYECGTPIPGKW
ncbi:target of Nesh-SH3 isoform X2 [Syngnathoides biaculeatus]|uniref:target of Nesh-SH3 isoform X2 n=1 Tax=Syngnathoides biaculeatus TaxID=300417 RepID=UPI002ADE3505|nr:target of Nesh-SH3 isoform X2 [Syngnathoides biaculeatus]